MVQPRRDVVVRSLKSRTLLLGVVECPVALSLEDATTRDCTTHRELQNSPIHSFVDDGE
jgi:hypothetical protein